MFRRSVCSALIVCFLILVAALFAKAQQNAQQVDRSAVANAIDPKTYGGMKWRLIGPFRGGRVLAVTGVSSQPKTYYFGAVPGGVWKTTAGGVTWDPLFHNQRT